MSVSFGLLGANSIGFDGFATPNKNTAHFVTQTAYICAEVYTFLSNFDTLPGCVDGIDIGAGPGIEPASG
jgi:hypothetical protein